jgi:hypothetical protein
LEVDNAVAELKAWAEDAKHMGFDQLSKHLPRLAHLFSHNDICSQLLRELPKSELRSIVEKSSSFHDDFSLTQLQNRELSVDSKMRLGEQLAILIAMGEGKLNLWDYWTPFNMDFWEEWFHPWLRDLLWHFQSFRKAFSEQKERAAKTTPRVIGKAKTYALDLFISHSSKNKAFAKEMTEFLSAALAIPHRRVRCTSVEGYKLSGGAATEHELRKEIQSARCFVGLITQESLQSQFVLFELGARWGSEEHFVPVLGCGINAEDLRPPLSNLNVLNSANKGDMEQLVHELATALKRSPPPRSIYERHLAALAKLKNRR